MEKEERFDFGYLIIDVVVQSEEDDPLLAGDMGLLFLGPEERVEGAPAGSPEQFSNKILDVVRFKTKQRLENIRSCLRVIEKEITEEQEEHYGTGD